MGKDTDLAHSHFITEVTGHSEKRRGWQEEEKIITKEFKASLDNRLLSLSLPDFVLLGNTL